MKTIYANRVPTLLMILIIDHVLQANSASFEPDPGTVYSGRNRNLRKLPSPPTPKLGQAPHYRFKAPPAPPPPTTEIRSTAQNLRVVRKGSPPAPKLSRTRNFSTFISPPGPVPPPPPPPMPQHPPAVKGRYSNCKIPPPPPESS